MDRLNNISYKRLSIESEDEEEDPDLMDKKSEFSRKEDHLNHLEIPFLHRIRYDGSREMEKDINQEIDAQRRYAYQDGNKVSSQLVPGEDGIEFQTAKWQKAKSEQEIFQ